MNTNKKEILLHQMEKGERFNRRATSNPLSFGFYTFCQQTRCESISLTIYELIFPQKCFTHAAFLVLQFGFGFVAASAINSLHKCYFCTFYSYKLTLSYFIILILSVLLAHIRLFPTFGTITHNFPCESFSSYNGAVAKKSYSMRNIK